VSAGISDSCFCHTGIGWNPAAIGFFQRLGYAHDVRFAWAASAIAGLGILLAAWAWFRHRSRHHGRVPYQCPRCRYDLRGIVQERSYPLQCSECALDIGSEYVLTTPRLGWRLPGVALLLLAAAYLTAIWPEVRFDGWTRLVPSTVLVLQPMDVAAWTDARMGPWSRLARPLSTPDALASRLSKGNLWPWQEWLLFKRIERSCRARNNYGVTPAQYDMSERLLTTPAVAPDEESLARRLARFAESTGVAFMIDWESFEAYDWQGRDLLVEPVRINATVAGAMDRLLDRDGSVIGMCWDITPDGVVVIDDADVGSTTRTRLYDVSLLVEESFGLAGREWMTVLQDLVLETIEPDDWTANGGPVNGLFGIGDHLIVIATARMHFQVEDLLDNLTNAIAATLESVPPYRLEGSRPLLVRSEYVIGMLDYLRIERTISRQTLRSAGPTFSDGVTAEELEACDRAAFGLLDRLR